MSSSSDPVRVVLAEDSAVTRQLLTEIVREEPGFQLIAAVGDGESAVEAVLRHHPSVVAMDLHMPGMNGAEATRRIMQTAPTPIVIVTASDNLDGSLMYDALAAGALSVVPRPLGPASPAHAKRRKNLLNELRLMSDVRVIRRSEAQRLNGGAARTADRAVPARSGGSSPAVPTPTVPPLKPPVGARAPRVIAIGASTGGPAALLALLSRLPAQVDVPILVVQHIAAGFTEGLAWWLSRETRPTVVGQEGMALKRGQVIIAPDERHLRVGTDGRIHLGQDRAVSGHRPSATVLFESIAATFGPAAAGIVMTGMGRDGADGLLTLSRAGATTIVQSPDTAVVSGMPAAAIDAGAGAHVVGLDDIAGFVTALVLESRRDRSGRTGS